MPYSQSRQTRERRLRAKYRRKTAVTSIITLIVGLIVGFVLCVLSVNHDGPMSRLLKIGPLGRGDAPAVISEEATPAPTPIPLDGDLPEDFTDDAFGAPEGADLGGLTDGDDSFAALVPDGGEAPEGGEDAGIETAKAGEDGMMITALEPTEAPTPEPTEEPTPEPTATPEPTPEPTPTPVIIPYGEACTMQTQIYADGSERSIANDEPFETLSLTMKVDAYKNPAYFQEQYATQYKLQGDEAAVQFDITLNGYTGAAPIIPQNFLLITFVGDTPDVTNEGYQLMDAEIAGKTEVAIASNTTSTLYKRYSHSADQGDMVYMSVTTFNDGVQSVYWFEVLAPEPVETATPEPTEGEDGEAAEDDDGGESTEVPSGQSLTVGSKGDAVVQLQKALIKKGVLSGDPDGKFGNYTAEAVRSLQRTYGMEATGIADAAFLERLYSDQ